MTSYSNCIGNMGGNKKKRLIPISARSGKSTTTATKSSKSKQPKIIDGISSRLFIGGLFNKSELGSVEPKAMQQATDEICKRMCSFGSVEQLDVIKDDNGKPKGFAFVTLTVKDTETLLQCKHCICVFNVGQAYAR